MPRGRPPICKICGQKLNIETAYQVITHNSNGIEQKSFYCSQDEFEQNAKPKKKKKSQSTSTSKDKVYRLFCEILGVNGITNTAIWKEKSEINRVFSDDLIIAYLEENKERLTNIVDGLNGGIYGKIRYVSVVLKNSLGDYTPKTNTNTMYNVYIPDEHYEMKYKNKARVALEDLEEECCE